MLKKGSAAAIAWGRKMLRLRKNAVKFRSYSPKKRAALRRYVKKHSGGTMSGARRALFHGLVRSGEHSVRTFKRRGVKAWLRGNPKKSKAGQLKQIGYKEVDIKDYMEREHLSRAEAIKRLFKHEQEMLRRQGTLETPELRLNSPLSEFREALLYSISKGLTKREKAAWKKLISRLQVYPETKAELRALLTSKRNLMGYKDHAGVFHPIRASRDYDEGAAYSGGLERERSSMMREVEQDIRGGYTPKSQRAFKTKRRAPLTYRQREDFSKRMYDARMEKRRAGRRSFRNPGKWKVFSYPLRSGITGRHIRMATGVIAPDGSKYLMHEKMSKREAVAMAKAGHGIKKNRSTQARSALRKLFGGSDISWIGGSKERRKDLARYIKQKRAGRRPRKNPIHTSGRFHKFYEKLLTITVHTDKGPRTLRPSKKTAIYGDKTDRRRVVLVGEPFTKELEGLKVLRVDATGNISPKRDDIKRGDKFYHPFTAPARLSKDGAGHLVIKSSRPIWTPRDF